MKPILVLILTMILGAENSTAQWSYMGLHNKKINSLDLEGDHLFAATDSGLFRKEITTLDTLWSLIGFPDIRVNDIYTRNANFIYASVAITGIESDTITLYVTQNGGIDWSPLWGEYDPSASAYLEALDIEGVANNSDTIIMMSGGIRRSVDGGGSFANTFVQGGRFLAIAESDPDHMWTGGEGAFLNPVLIRSVNGGTDWNFNDPLEQIVTGDDACLSAAIHPLDHNKVYVGMEGHIGKTVDNGSNWITLLPSAYYMKVVMISPTNPSVIYASGGTFGGQDITLFVSTDEGMTWSTFQQNISADVDVLSSAITSGSGIDLVYLGTRTNGVYKFESSPVGYAESRVSAKSIVAYPNPFNETTLIEFENPHANDHTLLIINSHGQRVRTMTDITTSRIRIEGKDLARGIYFFQLLRGSQTIATGKLIAE